MLLLHRKTYAWIQHRDVRVNTPVRGTADVRVGPVENGRYSSVTISLWRETEVETTNCTTGPQYYWSHTDFYGVRYRLARCVIRCKHGYLRSRCFPYPCRRIPVLAMISLHTLTFRLMVTMVADFCSLVILIHNTLLGEIIISST